VSILHHFGDRTYALFPIRLLANPRQYMLFCDVYIVYVAQCAANPDRKD